MKGGKSKSDSKSSSKLYVTTKPTKGAAAAKDPNKPKRHPSDFFVFLEDFWKQFKEKHLNNKSVAAVGKAARNKWKDPVCRMKCVVVASKHPVYELGAADLVVRSSPLNDTGF